MRTSPRYCLSRLGEFIKLERVTAVMLAEQSGVSREYIGSLRYGRSEPTRIMMIWLAGGAARIIRRPVKVDELFDLTVPS